MLLVSETLHDHDVIWLASNTTDLPGFYCMCYTCMSLPEIIMWFVENMHCFEQNKLIVVRLMMVYQSSVTRT